MADGRQRAKPVSQAVRGAFETLKRRLNVKAPAVRQTWQARLDVEVPALRTMGELLGSAGTHGVSVDDLLCLSYCLGVSPAATLRLAWRQEPWPLLDRTQPGAGGGNRVMDDWLWGLRPLPGQDLVEFEKNMPGKLLIREGGFGLRGEWALRLGYELEQLLEAADEARGDEMRAAESRLKNSLTRLAQSVQARGGLAVQDEERPP